MPELPEVETIVRALKGNIGAQIENFEIIRQDMIRQEEFAPEKLKGKTIYNIRRRGKFLVFELDADLYLVFHLGMSGRFFMVSGVQETDKHIHAKIHLNNDTLLIFRDPRRFGGIWFICDIEKFFRHLGKEPLAEEFTSSYLKEILSNRKAPVKNLLLNQNLISGIGNIYADEALFAAGIRPDRSAASLNQDEIEKLHHAIRQVLHQGIEFRGTTFRDYRDAFNESGNFQNHLKVYGRYNQPCLICNNPIQRLRIGGRSSHFCNNCQH